MSAATFQSEFKGNVVCILTSPPSFQIPKTWKHDFSRAKQEISDNMSAALELLYATQFDFISVCSQILVDCKQNYFWKSSHMCAIERLCEHVCQSSSTEPLAGCEERESC